MMRIRILWAIERETLFLKIFHLGYRLPICQGPLGVLLRVAALRLAFRVLSCCSGSEAVERVHHKAPVTAGLTLARKDSLLL